jgi:hypothetical protein
MHWLFGDQLGPHFLRPSEDSGLARDSPLLMIEPGRCSGAGAFTGPRHTWSSPRCVTGRPNSATASPTFAATPNGKGSLGWQAAAR